MENSVGYTSHDVLLGRHKLSFRHPGNTAFREIIKSFAIRYEVAETRKHKMAIVAQVKWAIQKSRGRFLQNEGGFWRRASVRTIQAKISHALRDHLTKIKGRPISKKAISTTTEKQRLTIRSIPQVISSAEVTVDPYSIESSTIVTETSQQEPSDQLVDQSWVEFYARQFSSIDVEIAGKKEAKKKEVFVVNSVQDIYSLYVEDLYELDQSDFQNLGGIPASITTTTTTTTSTSGSVVPMDLTRFCLETF